MLARCSRLKKKIKSSIWFLKKVELFMEDLSVSKLEKMNLGLTVLGFYLAPK